MSITYTEITLKNAGDTIRVKDGHMKASEAREMTVQAMVDTGSTDMVISEAIRQKLGLDIEGSEKIELANNQFEVCPVTEPLRVYWKDRGTVCTALVMPGESEVLLGALPMEAMDLTVNPARQEVVGTHGPKAKHFVK
jgi:clan AA aspartic protease